MTKMSVPTTYGHLVTYASLDNASLVHNTLYRYPVPGNKNATSMGTNINMNGFTISNLPMVSSGGNLHEPKRDRRKFRRLCRDMRVWNMAKRPDQSVGIDIQSNSIDTPVRKWKPDP